MQPHPRDGRRSAEPAAARNEFPFLEPIDAAPALGTSSFYDQTSVQFVHKLPGGDHIFWVKADCGESRVKFRLGK